MKHLIGTVATLVTFTLVFGLTRAVQAQPAEPVREYYTTVGPRGLVQEWFWVDRELGIIGCPKCTWLIDHEATVVLSPTQELAVKGGIMSGLKLLSDAKVAETPELEAVLRSEVQVQLAAAARALGGATLRTGMIGYFNPDTGAKIRSYQSWLAEAHQDIADGIALFQRGLAAEPWPSPWFEAGMAKLDQAYAKLYTKR